MTDNIHALPEPESIEAKNRELDALVNDHTRVRARTLRKRAEEQRREELRGHIISGLCWLCLAVGVYLAGSDGRITLDLAAPVTAVCVAGALIRVWCLARKWGGQE